MTAKDLQISKMQNRIFSIREQLMKQEESLFLNVDMPWEVKPAPPPPDPKKKTEPKKAADRRNPKAEEEEKKEDPVLHPRLKMKNDTSFIERKYEIGDEEVYGFYPHLELLGHLRPDFRFAPR